MSLSRPPLYNANVSTMGPILHASQTNFELSPLIGAPTQKFSTAPDFNMRRELATVASNFEGHVVHLATFLNNLFTTTGNNWVYNLFRLERFGDINWDIEAFHFDSFLAPATPSQAAPPVPGYKKTRQTGTMKRYAAAVSVLTDTLKNPEGDMIFQAMTIQALQSFNRTMESLVLSAMINVRALYLKFWAEAADYAVDLISRATTDLVTFDAMHRYPDAPQKLLGLAQQAMNDSARGKITAVIVPEGWRELTASSGVMNLYNKRGPEAAEIADNRGDAVGLQATYLPNSDVRIYVAAAIDATGQGLHVNQMVRKVEIGGWGAIDNYGSSAPPSQWRSYMLDPDMFDMSVDNFKRVSFLDALNYCGRFDASGKLVALHKTMARDAASIAASHRLNISNKQLDMFAFATTTARGEGFADVTHYGHMESWALTDDVVKKHVATMSLRLQEALGGATDAFFRGVAMMERLYNLPITATDVAWARKDNGVGALGKSAASLVGGPVLATAPPTPGATNYLPRFFGTAGGMFTLATAEGAAEYISAEVFEAARGFLHGVEILHAFLVKIYGNDHPLLSAQFCPEAFSSDNAFDGDKYKGYLNFAHNVIGNNPALIAGNTAAANPRGNVADEFADVTEPAVLRALADGTLKNKFESGLVGKAYVAYLAASQASTRTPAPAAAVSFDKFVRTEITNRSVGLSEAKRTYVANRILGHILTATTSDAPYVFARETLDALASDANFAEYAASAGGAALASAEFATRLAASPARVAEYNKLPGASKLFFVSAFGKSNAASASAPNQDDPFGSTISSRARIGSTTRDEPAPQYKSTSTAPFTAFVDIGVDVVYDRAGVPRTRTNKNMLARIEAARAIGTPLLEKIAGLMLATAEVHRNNLVKFYEFNVVPPVGFVVGRPRRTYKTACAIFVAQGNDDIGTAAYAMMDVRRGYDAAGKKLFDHYSGYMAAIVRDAARILLMPDVMIVGYEGGETTTPVLPPSIDNDNQPSGGSMYYIMVPAGSAVGPKKTIPETFDIRGRFSGQLQQFMTNSAGRQFLGNDAPHYPSAVFTNLLYKLSGVNRFNLPAEVFYRGTETKANTIMSRELSMVNIGNGAPTATVPQDQMGMSVYPGCGKRRTGGGFSESAQGAPHANTIFLAN